MPIGWKIFLIALIVALGGGLWLLFRKPHCCGRVMKEKSFKDSVRTYVCPICGHEVARMEPVPDDFVSMTNRFPY